MARKSRKRTIHANVADPRSGNAAPAAFSAGQDEVAVGETVATAMECPPVDPPTFGHDLALAGQNELLTRMAEQISQLLEMASAPSDVATDANATAERSLLSNAELESLRHEVDELATNLQSMKFENEELRQQNSDLATRLASVNVRSTVSSVQSSTSDALTWDQRKELIWKQMEEESFDAEAFVSDLQAEFDDESETPTQFVHSILHRLDRSDGELAKREAEIGELRMLLQQRSNQPQSGVAIGAAAIAEMIDADELIVEERARLQLMQAEWEEKFRRSEIDASLERAKLSRERQQLAEKTAKLDEQMEHLRREVRQTEETGSASSRRWMVKLGLAGT